MLTRSDVSADWALTGLLTCLSELIWAIGDRSDGGYSRVSPRWRRVAGIVVDGGDAARPWMFPSLRRSLEMVEGWTRSSATRRTRVGGPRRRGSAEKAGRSGWRRACSGDLWVGTFPLLWLRDKGKRGVRELRKGEGKAWAQKRRLEVASTHRNRARTAADDLTSGEPFYRPGGSKSR